MKFEAWFKFPDMTIGVHESKGIFRCHHFHGELLSRKNSNDCHSILELKYYLLSIPNAPKKEIMLLIRRLDTQKLQKKLVKHKIE